MNRYISIILILALVLLTDTAEAQIQSKIGFNCGYAATQTKPVVIMDGLVENKDYDSIRNKLSSHNNGIVFLSVVLCEILEDKELITLTKREKIKISRAYKSNKEISLCAGCSYSGKTTMINLLNEVDYDGWGYNFKKTAIARYKEMIEKSNKPLSTTNVRMRL